MIYNEEKISDFLLIFLKMIFSEINKQNENKKIKKE